MKTFIWLLVSAVLAHYAHSDESLGWVLDSFTKGEITFLTLNLRQNDLQGHVVRVGKNDFAVVGPLSHEEEGLYFYEASAPGQIFPKRGTVISEIPVGAPSDTPKTTIFLRTRKIPFAPKRIGKITAVEENKVLFDRGTLHEVHERDIYAIYDSSGRYKGKYEVRGIGDLQSIGKMYAKGKKEIEEGDRVVFLGQRKLYNFGPVISYSFTNYKNEFNKFAPTILAIGGGLNWSHTFPNGWGWEMVYGIYNWGRWEGAVGPPVPAELGDFTSSTEWRSTRFIFPAWLRKNFFYPHWFSPYLAAGISIMWANGRRDHATPGTFKNITESSAVILPAPVVGGGIEFWPGKFFHPRLEVRYFIAPSLLGRPDRPLYIGFGFLTSW